MLSITHHLVFRHIDLLGQYGGLVLCMLCVLLRLDCAVMRPPVFLPYPNHSKIPIKPVD